MSSAAVLNDINVRLGEDPNSFHMLRTGKPPPEAFVSDGSSHATRESVPYAYILHRGTVVVSQRTVVLVSIPVIQGTE